MSTSHNESAEKALPILVVDDESTVRDEMVQLIGELGYQAITAKNGIDALEMSISAGPFQAIVTDVHMPRLDGLELGKIIRHTSGNLPIIFVSSGFGGPGFFYTRNDLKEVSPYLLLKPIDKDEFKKVVKSALESVHA